MPKLFLFITFILISTLSFAQPLPAAQAFKLTVKPLDPNTLLLHWDIKPGYFLYKKRIHFIVNTPNMLQLGEIQMPQAMNKTDRLGKTFAIYRNQLDIAVPVLGDNAGEIATTLRYQGCSDAGFCYPPHSESIKLILNHERDLIAAEIESIAKPVIIKPHRTTSPLEQLFVDHGWVVIVICFYGFGLLLSFTPCVLPMVPVLSGIIIGHGHDLTTRKAVLLSCSYVISMSLTYSAIGAVIALMGSNLQIIMQSPWAISLFGLLFIVIALSMFNVYELHLPISWQSKLAQVTRRQASGHYLSAAFMGCLSILILSPCVTPPLIGVLSYVAQSGNLTLGIFALFFLGLGMGTPLILIGASAGKLLPKAGRWMNAVKALFGIIFLAVAIYLLSRILPVFITMVLWASLLIFSGIYLGALRKAIGKYTKLRQGLGLILLVYGLLILVGASLGNSNPLQPLTPTPAPAQKPIIVTTVAETNRALAQAHGKPVLLDFYADWCTSCQLIEHITFQQPAIQRALTSWTVIKVDLTANNAESQALMRQYRVIAPPTFIFIGNNGQELGELRLVGEVSDAIWLKHLR